jgi:hypothetical protein
MTDKLDQRTKVRTKLRRLEIRISPEGEVDVVLDCASPPPWTLVKDFLVNVSASIFTGFL